MRIARIIICLVVALLTVLWATPVYADTELPDSTPTVEEFGVWRNLLEAGDFFLLIYANIPYATPPSTPIDETFMWRLFDTDNVTELASTGGYAYHNDGYGYNVFSVYFGADDAPTWGISYLVRLNGNPINFEEPPIYNFQLSSSDYSSMTDQDDAQLELSTKILTLATDLNNKWSVEAGYELTLETDTGTALSMYGETFFRGAIYGCQGLAPYAFRGVFETISMPDREWNPSYASTTLPGQFTGTWIDTARAAGATLFGTSYDLASIILVLVILAGIFVANLYVGGGVWGGLLDGSIIALLFSRASLIPLGFMGLVAAFCVIYTSTRLKAVFSS